MIFLILRKIILMKKLYYLRTALGGIALLLSCSVQAQVDTSYIYNSNMPYGTLDIRLRKSATRYYYLQENKTFSYRQSGGTRTNTYRDMTGWDSSPYTQGNLREKSGNNDYFIMNYRLLFPGGYQPGYSKGYPLVVMMHGAGERGNCWDNNCYHDDRNYNPNANNPPAPTTSTSELLNNDHNLLHGGKPHLDARNRAGSRLPDDPTLHPRAFPGFVLFPQNLNGWYAGTVQDAIRLIRLLVNKHNIDPDRIYIHGLSNGGIAVYEALKRAPWLFAAALPMSAPSEAGVINQQQLPSIAHIPFWIFQGGQDVSPTPTKTENYIRTFRAAGMHVRYSMYANLGHGVWNTAYNEPDFFSWMLDQTKARVHVFGGVANICHTTGEGVRMAVAKGFHAYQWQRNGVTISGATAATYEATTTGTYRARFSRVKNPSSGDWNEWSDPVNVTDVNPGPPVVEQTGTVLLRDLNNYNYAHLYTTANAAYYYWYKNGVLQNLPGSRDDTTRYVRFSAGNCSGGPCPGNGAYTLIVKDASMCPTPPSVAKHVVFNNQAPVNISAPTNFTGQVMSSTSVKLNWNENASNEGGFEIWRRQVISGTTYSKWEMPALTGPNVRTFTDSGLEPSTTYHYKIRAVSNTGRSNYTPSASNAWLQVHTSGDTQAPTSPTNLTAAETGIKTITLNWTASTDNTGIKQYRIYYGTQSKTTGSPVTQFTLTDLDLNHVYDFVVKAEDLDGNLSAPSNTATADTYAEGLYYEHTTGAWTDIDQINWNGVPEFTGHVSAVTLSPRTQEDYFNFKFDGYLYVADAGTYQFRTTSSDGSRVELDGAIVVNNDGVHGNKTVTGANRSLGAGARRIVVKFFDYDGVHSLTVQYKGPDTNGSWITIPASAFRSGNPQSSLASAVVAATGDAVESATQPELHLDVFPNPAPKRGFNVRVETDGEAPLTISLMDFTGNEILNSEFTADEVRNGFRIEPTGSLRQGLYVLTVRQGELVLSERVSVK